MEHSIVKYLPNTSPPSPAAQTEPAVLKRFRYPLLGRFSRFGTRHVYATPPEKSGLVPSKKLAPHIPDQL